MISEEFVQKDIEEVCNLTKSVYGFYTDLNSYDKDGKPTKLTDFLEKARQLMGKNARRYLCTSRFLRQQRGGDYDFNFPLNVINGGGMTYAAIGQEDGNDYNAVYFYDKETWIQKYGIYHELGHLMQKHLNLFCRKEVREIYKFMSKGVNNRRLSKSEISKRFVSASNYIYHLCETHANAFATACMILRSQTDLDRKKSSLNSDMYSGSKFFEGLIDTEKEYPGMKYYSNIPLQKAIIKEVNSWYKNDKLSDYISAEGSINFEALAQKTHEIVLEHAYSPEEFRRFLDYKIYGRRNKGEKHKWNQSVFESIIGRIGYKLPRLVETQPEYLYYFDVISEDRNRAPFKALPETDEEAKLLNICCRFDNTIVDMNNSFDLLDIETLEYDEIDFDKPIYYGSIPKTVIRSLSRKIARDNNVSSYDAYSVLLAYSNNVNDIFKRDYDKNAVCALMNAMNEPAGRSMIWEQYYKRAEDPQYKLDLQNIIDKHAEEPEMPSPKDKLRLFKEIRQLVINDAFENLPQFSPEQQRKMQHMIIEIADKNPDSLQEDELSKKIVASVSKRTNKKTLRTVDDTLDRLHTLYFLNTELFNTTLSQFRTVLNQSIDIKRNKSEIHRLTKNRER